MVLARGQAGAVGVGQAGGGPDASEDFQGFVLVAVQAQDRVGGHRLQAERCAQLRQFPTGLLLLGQAVVLQFQEVPVFPQQVAVPTRDFGGLRVGSLAQPMVEFALRASREEDQSLVVGGQEFPVDPGAPLEPLRVGAGDQPGEVPVAGLQLLHQGHQEERLGQGPVLDLAGSHPQLGAEDGLDLGILAGGLEFDGAEHVAAIGEGHRPHAAFGRLGREGLGRTDLLFGLLVGFPLVDEAAGPLEHGIFGTDMEMDEAHGDEQT